MEKKDIQKHAYLILAHDNFLGLSYLLKALDDENNDIYIHIDKKSNFRDEEMLKNSCTASSVYFVTRYSIYWGDSSIIKAEYELFKTAIKQNYHYYHLISGSHFPSRSQKEIHDIFKNENRLYIDCHEERSDDPFYYKIMYYYPFKKYHWNIVKQDGMNYVKLWIITKIFYMMINFQKKLKVSRLNPDYVYYKGNQWVSLPHDFVEFLLSKEKETLKAYKNTSCSDEIFIPTIAVNSCYKSRIHYYSNTYVDWNRGQPYAFKYEDYDELVSVDYIFARKIIYDLEPDLVKKLLSRLKI